MPVTDKQTIIWIKDVLTNDEYSSDEELIEYFMTEGKLEKEDAQHWVSKRFDYLNKLNFI